MRNAALIAIVLSSLAVSAQEARRGGDWIPYPDAKGCIGGSSCPERQLRVALQDRAVLGVRFHAHDQIGSKADGMLRVRLDGTPIREYLDIPRAGQTFTIDVDELRGRALIFEPQHNDEVEISDVAVLYARDAAGRIPRDRGRDRIGNGGWQSYPRAAACIGGSVCGRNGNRITIALEDAPVLGVRFSAHDNIGDRAGGRLTVRIDSTTIAWSEDVKREGKHHEIDVDNVTGTRLVIEANDDEVDVKDIEVLYGRRRRGGGPAMREVQHEGACIGGSQCGGSRARIRIPIYGRPIESIRFYARDDIGARAGGELRISIDDQVLRDYLDIPREGKTFTIEGRGLFGDYVYISPAEDDEVEVKDIRVRFGDD